MDTLARLMDELSLALKARSDAGLRTEALAHEVEGLPKLSVIAPSRIDQSRAVHDEEAGRKLHLQLELQNLSHTKQQALEFLQNTAQTVARIREAINTMAAQDSLQCAEVAESYRNRILFEKHSYAELEQQKQDLHFEALKRMAKLEQLQKAAEGLLDSQASHSI